MQRWPHPRCRKSQPQTYSKQHEPLTEMSIGGATWEHNWLNTFATHVPAAASGSAHKQPEVARPASSLSWLPLLWEAQRLEWCCEGCLLDLLAPACLEMYEGTVATKAEASRPAPCPLISFTNRYVASAHSDENKGAVNTQTCRPHVAPLAASSGSVEGAVQPYKRQAHDSHFVGSLDKGPWQCIVAGIVSENL